MRWFATSRRRCRALQPRPKRAAFRVAPSVAIADRASTRTTVVEVNARDRAGACSPGSRARSTTAATIIHSAHIATYGERAVDVFYLTRADGRKLEAEDVEQLRAALLDAARETSRPRAA